MSSVGLGLLGLNFPHFSAVDPNLYSNFLRTLNLENSAYRASCQHMLNHHGYLNYPQRDGETYFAHGIGLFEVHQLFLSVFFCPNLWVRRGNFILLVGAFEEAIGRVHYSSQEHQPCHLLFVVLNVGGENWRVSTAFPILFYKIPEKIRLPFQQL